MDINSILLAGSLTLGEVMDGGVQHLQNMLLQPMNHDIRVKSVEHHGTRFSFQYQHWQVRPKSVCIEYAERLIEYAQCTQVAKNYFIEACRVMNESPKSGDLYDRYKSLYCSAAVEFKPTVANISVPKASDTAALEARRNCSLATLKARETGLEKDEELRKAACKPPK